MSVGARILRRRGGSDGSRSLSKIRIHYREDGRIVSSSSAPFDERFACKHCGANQQSFAALRNHERVHTGERPFKCDLCTKCFKMPHHLYDHQRTHTGEKPFACQYCEKKFVQRSNLRQHEQTVHPEAKHYPCQHCTARFQNRHELKDHHLWHLSLLRSSEENEKNVPEIEPYACRYCPARFVQRSKLNNHIRWHLDGNKDDVPPLSPTPPPIFQLEIDNSDSDLSPRRIYKNADIEPPQPEQEFMIVKCRLCPRKFSRSSYLRAHMNQVHLRDFEDFKRPNILRTNTLRKFNQSPSQGPSPSVKDVRTEFASSGAPSIRILKSYRSTRIPNSNNLFTPTVQPIQRSRIRTEPQPFHESKLTPPLKFNSRVPLNAEDEEMDESENFGDEGECQFCFNGLARASSTDNISCGHCKKSERENNAKIVIKEEEDLEEEIKPISIVDSSNPSIFETVEMKCYPDLDVEYVTVKVENVYDLDSILGM